MAVLESLGQFWWILPWAAYLIVLWTLMRRGLWASVGRRFHLAAICVFVLLIPSMQWGGGYPFAIVTVLNVLLHLWADNGHATTSSTLREE